MPDWKREILRRLAAVQPAPKRADEILEEMAQHLDDRYRELLAGGEPENIAYRKVMDEFSEGDLLERNLRTLKRAVKGAPIMLGEQPKRTFLGGIGQDVRYGLRMLAKSPGFTAVAILTLALGIGANTAIFSLIDAVMLRSLPVKDPSQLVLLQWSARQQPEIHGFSTSNDCANTLSFRGQGSANPSGCAFSEPMFRKIEEAKIFSGAAAFAGAGQLSLTGNGAATVVSGQYVSGDFFRTMGLNAAAGRLLDASDDKPGAAPVAVLNYGYWQSAFGGSRDAIGRTIELNNIAFQIVGVTDQKFTGLTPGSDFDVWIPLADAERVTNSRFWNGRQSDAGFWWLVVVARMKNGQPLQRAQAEVSGVFRNETMHGSSPVFGATAGPQRRLFVMGGGASPKLPGGLPIPMGKPGGAQGGTRMTRQIGSGSVAIPPGGKLPEHANGNTPLRMQNP